MDKNQLLLSTIVALCADIDSNDSDAQSIQAQRKTIDFGMTKKPARRFTSILALLILASFSVRAVAAVGVWTYAGQNFPTEAAALAAMHAVSPQKALLTQFTGIVGINASSVTYKYGAPNVNPSTFSNWWYCTQANDENCLIWAANPDYYTSEAVAEASWPAPPPCTWTVVPTSDWTPYAAQPPLVGQVRSYNDLSSYPPACVSPFTTYRFLIRYEEAGGCPTYYTLMSGSCVDSDTDIISYRLLECPDSGSPSTAVGDPCDVLTGDFSQTEPDYSAAGPKFARYYHSATLESNHALGVGWTHNYAAYLVLTNGIPTGLLRPDGHHDALTSSTSGVYISLSGAAIHVQQSGANWIATLKDGSSEVYNSTGQLIQKVSSNGQVTALVYNASNQLASVTDPFGHSLQFAYNTSGNLQQLADPAGNVITYAYDANNNLISATYQDSTARQYLYENSAFPNNLTGIIDESTNRFLTVGYDPTTGAVVSSQQAGGAQAVSITYSANGAVSTNGLGETDTYTFTNDPNYAPRVTSLARNTLTQLFTVPPGSTDPQRRVTQSVDANGNVTDFTYDPDHMTSKTQAFGSPVARTASYQFLATSSALPTLVTEALRQTSYVYYPGTNNVHTKTITDTTVTPNVSRTWTYTYNANGQVLTVDGPRTDVSDITTYTYYTCTTGVQCGQVSTVTTAATANAPSGLTTTFNTYNVHGRPLTMTDPNGVVTTMTYDLRQRLRSQQIGTETTSYSYYPTGLLETVTLPDTSTITYTYDGAHRLTDITDRLGDHIHYTLDAMGNHTAETTLDPSSSLRRTHTRVINTLNELAQDVNSAGTAAVTTTLTYDSNGNVLSSDAPLARNTANQYDALNRLKQVTDPAAGVTKLSYDANDNLASAVDPRNLTTAYTHDGFGDVTHLISPDTGTTSSTYDSGGNLKTATDARGAVATYSYDAINRVTQVAYTDQTINFTYDAGTNGSGRLTGASDANHSLSWAYDALGRVTGKGQTIGTLTKSVGYSYINGDLTSLVTPSGQTVVYGYTNHHITSITVNGSTILSGVTYDPFGPANAWTWGNGTTVSRTFDEDGNPAQIVSAGITNGYTVDSASRITGISNNSGSTNSWTFGYDLLDRLISGTGAISAGPPAIPSAGPPAVAGFTNRGYTYDASSNRLTTTGTNASVEKIAATSNRLSSTTGSIARTYSYDAAGNTLGYASNSYSFNKRGRMSQAIVSGAYTNYIYNALGQLIEKSATGGTTLLMYDESGHILGEYTGTGALIQETIWMGDTPVATLRPNGSSISFFFVHTDHQGTPREITRASDNGLMWSWDPDTFGSVAPNSNPAGHGAFTYNLRYPGQYSLNESGLYYNYFRTYDPQMGRYIESDPIGLRGGINTYAYVGGNPVSNSDPSGLLVYVGEHGAFYPWVPIQHTAIVLQPDNPADFDFPNNTATLGGQPGGPGQTISGPVLGYLQSSPNNPGDSPGTPCKPGPLGNLTLVPTPPGMTDTQFINALMNAANSYQNDRLYALFPDPFGIFYNSNSYTSGVIISAGGTPPSLPGFHPGYSNPLPLP